MTEDVERPADLSFVAQLSGEQQCLVLQPGRSNHVALRPRKVSRHVQGFQPRGWLHSRRAVQHLLRPIPSFRPLTVSIPEPPHRSCYAERGSSISTLDRPGEGRAQVVVLDLQAVQPLTFLRPPEPGLSILSEDGSRLDAVAHRLKLAWDVRSPLLPGCLLVLYDLFRGFPRRLSFCADAARSELQHAAEQLAHLPKETLLIADRLYASVKLVAALRQGEVWLLCRRNRRLTVRHQQWLRRGQIAGGTLMERLVEVGSGQGTPPQVMRQIRYTTRRLTLDLLTSVLDPTRLRAEDALACYRLRWQVERLFFDLKEVLDLHRFYLASPQGVAQQVYAAALVYVALRVSQARIAQEHHLAPEELSPAKLFPRVARASVEITSAELYFLATQRANPTVVLHKPDWATLPHLQVALAALRVEPRRGTRRKRRYCASRRRWTSFMRIPGARRKLS